MKKRGVGSHISTILFWSCQKYSERFDFSSFSELHLGKGVQIQQKYIQDSIKKVTESVLPKVSWLTKFCNEVDAM